MPTKLILELHRLSAAFRTPAFKRFAVFCFLLGLVAAASWPLNPFANPPLSVIRIEATGARDPAGKSAEVWITRLPKGVHAKCLLGGASGADRSSGTPGWEQRGTILVSYTNQPAVIQCTAPAAVDDAIQFARTPWSGDAVITINGQSRRLHLYSAAGDTLILRMNEFPIGEPRQFGVLRSFLKFVLATVLVALAFIMAGLLLGRWVSPAMPHPVSGGLIRLAVLSLPPLMVFSVILAGTWPAQMSADSVVNWVSVNKMRFNNAHPPLPAVLIGLPGMVLGSIGFAMVIQIILLAGSIGCLALEISNWKNGKVAAWASASVTALFPSVALLTTVYWKDITYTAFLALLTAIFIAALRTGGKNFRDWRMLALAALLLFLVAACRHNGLIASVIIMGSLLWLFRRELGKRSIATLVAGGLLAPLLWNNFLLPATGRVAPVPEYYAGLLPMHLLGSIVAADNVLPSDTLSKMESILPISAWKARYDCENVNPLFHTTDVNRKNLSRNLLPYAFGAAFQFPATTLRHILCMNKLNWQLSPSRNSISVPLGVRTELFANFPQFEVNASPVASIQVALRSLYLWSATETLPAIVFWRPAGMQLLLLFLAGALILLKGNRTAPLALIPVIANTASLVPLISTQDFRYQYPMYFIGIPLAIYFLAQFVGRQPGYGEGQTPFLQDRQVKSDRLFRKNRFRELRAARAASDLSESFGITKSPGK